MEFSVFHAYRRLARRGIVKPLNCPDCDIEYTLMLGEDDEPQLQCFSCLGVVSPGSRLYDDMRAVVKEHDDS